MRCIAESVDRIREAPPTPAPPGFSLRGFRPRDVPAVAGIVADALHEHYDTSLYHSLSQQWPSGFLVAADRSDTPIGFLLGVTQVEGEARILMFAVERDWRTRGVGTTLMTEFLARCRARGMRRSTLEVRLSNVPAIRFYARFRFGVTDLLRGYYSDGENGYQMTRDLP
ncbi:MAG: GNAT family N-acetyltransferase [Thermoplasmata archaeon]|nr:GNAT family N-acetyltransferase [Thermoplasmata archaeon]MCI4356612.1 GNAT family N-acetyltransferase [Thermoplasmata archaeon]